MSLKSGYFGRSTSGDRLHFLTIFSSGSRRNDKDRRVPMSVSGLTIAYLNKVSRHDARGNDMIKVNSNKEIKILTGRICVHNPSKHNGHPWVNMHVYTLVQPIRAIIGAEHFRMAGTPRRIPLKKKQNKKKQKTQGRKLSMRYKNVSVKYTTQRYS